MDSEFGTLCEIISDAGYEPISYSGRHMYGKECVAFVAEANILEAIANLYDAITNLYDACDDDYGTLSAAIRSAQTDSMGRDTVIYFPRIRWQNE